MALSLKFTVPFDEADGEGIVFFGNYFRLAHRALEQWLPQVGIPWKEWFDNAEFGVPLRHVEADYLKPLRPGDEYEVKIAVVDLGESSVHFSYVMLIGSAVVAKLKTSHVFVSRPDMKKLNVPADLVARLKKVAL
jgi:YbgC/YbaW family acyl-CoA thioester hydrolase